MTFWPFLLVAAYVGIGLSRPEIRGRTVLLITAVGLLLAYQQLGSIKLS